MLTGPPRRRRARPVADAPISSLLSQSEDLAKGWLLALLERAPLDDAPRILAADLARDGPRVCEAMLRAVADDADERRLEPGGALAPLAARIGELAGASGAEATSHAVDALQAVVWAALRFELQSPDPDLITAIVERLAQVTELMRAAALRGSDGVVPAAPLSAVQLGARDPLVADRGPAITDLRFARRGDGASGSAGLIEREPEPPPPVAGREPAGPEPVASESVARESAAREPAAQASAAQASAARQSVAREWFGEQPAGDDPLWVSALNDEIRRTGGSPLSLVLAELEDADRVIAVESPRASAATFGEFAKAVRGAVRRHDILVCETDARAWIIARDTGRNGAQALGSRISGAVRESQQWRGAPMIASVGVAVLGEDGRSPSELIEAAEEDRFAAAASGVELLGGDSPDDD